MGRRRSPGVPVGSRSGTVPCVPETIEVEVDATTDDLSRPGRGPGPGPVNSCRLYWKGSSSSSVSRLPS